MSESKLIFDVKDGFLPADPEERARLMEAQYKESESIGARVQVIEEILAKADATTKSALFAQLREPFPEDEIEWLPQPTKRDGTQQKCQYCESIGKNPWHKCPAIHVAFIGHAAVTSRLNAVDPQWTYRPFALGTDGAPLIRQQGDRLVLWIWLKVLDVEKIGVGDTWINEDDDNPEKKLISDAIRNAAMRFGVGLELWKKDPSRPIHYVDPSGHWNQRVGGPPDQPVRAAQTSAQTHFVAKTSGNDGVWFVCRHPGCTYKTRDEAEAKRHAHTGVA